MAMVSTGSIPTSRELSRLPGVVSVDCAEHHRCLPGLAEAADVLILGGFDSDLYPLIEHRRTAGRITVFEANDYYFDLHSWNPLSDRWLDRATQDLFLQGLRLSDAVQTSTAELGLRWRQRTSQPVAVFANQLPEISPLPATASRPLTIGWGGSPGHFADWYSIAAGLEKWLESHPNVHLATMTHEFARSFLRLPPERYHFTPFGTLADYTRFLRSLDIGLAPLLPTSYNRCRSDIKFLEYASCGVVGIYADLEPYRTSVVQGETGFLYRTESELFEILDRLAVESDLRCRIREQAYAYVTEHRRLEDHIGERLEFYRSLLRGPRETPTIAPEVIAAAQQQGSYLQLRRQQPEETLLAALTVPASSGVSRQSGTGCGPVSALLGRTPAPWQAAQRFA